MSNHNPKSRAIVSALRSGIPELEAVAMELVAQAVERADTDRPVLALCGEFDASRNTAKAILRAKRELEEP